MQREYLSKRSHVLTVDCQAILKTNSKETAAFNVKEGRTPSAITNMATNR
jgi:hypothetical protein